MGRGEEPQREDREHVVRGGENIFREKETGGDGGGGVERKRRVQIKRRVGDGCSVARW